MCDRSSSSSSGKRNLEHEDTEEDLEAKRQKLLSDLVLTSEAMQEDTSGVYVDDDTNFKCLTYNDLKAPKYDSECYGCKYINTTSLAENEDYLYLMKLYTENTGSSSREAIFRNIKDFFDKYCSEYSDMDWSLESIREHFDNHTCFPTDELNKQITLNKKMRDFILSSVIYKKGDEIKVNNKNIKDVISIQREIRELLLLKSKINSMVGYNETLDY